MDENAVAVRLVALDTGHVRANSEEREGEDFLHTTTSLAHDSAELRAALAPCSQLAAQKAAARFLK